MLFMSVYVVQCCLGWFVLGGCLMFFLACLTSCRLEGGVGFWLYLGILDFGLWLTENC